MNYDVEFKACARMYVDVCEYLQYIELKSTGSLSQNDCMISHFCGCNKN